MMYQRTADGTPVASDEDREIIEALTQAIPSSFTQTVLLAVQKAHVRRRLGEPGEPALDRALGEDIARAAMRVVLGAALEAMPAPFGDEGCRYFGPSYVAAMVHHVSHEADDDGERAADDPLVPGLIFAAMERGCRDGATAYEIVTAFRALMSVVLDVATVLPDSLRALCELAGAKRSER
jgi:hypothetical protein